MSSAAPAWAPAGRLRDRGILALLAPLARRLGMTGTSYTDASGLDSSTTSTAADQVRLGMAAMQTPALAAITAMPAAVVPVPGLIRNTNTLLGQDGIAGLNTGSTQPAGGCLLVAARQQVDAHETLIVAAVLGQPGTAATILPNALQAGYSLVLALDRALGPGGPSAAPRIRESRRPAGPLAALSPENWPLAGRGPPDTP